MDHSYVKPVEDGNSAKNGRNTNFCCVPQCTTYSSPTIGLHLFPRDLVLKNIWETVLRMGKPASPTMRVCSLHFRQTDYFPGPKQRKRLFPHAVPSQNLPKRLHDKVLQSPKKAANEARNRRAQDRQHRKSGNSAFANQAESDVAATETSDDDVSQDDAESNLNVTLYMEASTQANLTADYCTEKSQGRSLADIISEMSSSEKACQANIQGSAQPSSSEINPQTPNVSLPHLLNNNARLFTFTGIHTLDLLESLVECVSDLIEEEPSNKMILAVRDRVILTMTKLKLNISFSALGVLFGISGQTCSNYFKNMCPRLSRVLKAMIPFPDQELLRNNLPLSFKSYKFTRIILDCAETTMEKCKCLKCRILTYSQYKKKIILLSMMWALRQVV